MSTILQTDAIPATTAHRTAAGLPVLGTITFSHFLNDLIQSLILAIYPLLKANFALSFTQIGLITLTYQCTASLLQPAIGFYTDRRPQRHALAVGMGFTLAGLVLLAYAPDFATLLCASALVGTGSSVFHPESSRVARMAANGRHGLAQSVFQVGGNAGSAVGPLLAAWIIMPHGQHSLAWFSVLALLAIVVLWQIGTWYAAQMPADGRQTTAAVSPLPRRRMLQAMLVLMVLVFSKYFYVTSLSSYYTFYLMERFGLGASSAQVYLFAFLFASAAGTVLGGPIGDRIGRKRVIWASILGVTPFTLLMPHVGLQATAVLSVIIGFVLASAFSAILVFAQELAPGHVGLVSGLFFGFAFGMGGIGAAILGHQADVHGITAVYQVCAFLPLLGVLTVFLPDLRQPRP